MNGFPVLNEWEVEAKKPAGRSIVFHAFSLSGSFHY